MILLPSKIIIFFLGPLFFLCRIFHIWVESLHSRPRPCTTVPPRPGMTPRRARRPRGTAGRGGRRRRARSGWKRQGSGRSWQGGIKRSLSKLLTTHIRKKIYGANCNTQCRYSFSNSHVNESCLSDIEKIFCDILPSSGSSARHNGVHRISLLGLDQAATRRDPVGLKGKGN